MSKRRSVASKKAEEYVWMWRDCDDEELVRRTGEKMDGKGPDCSNDLLVSDDLYRDPAIYTARRVVDPRGNRNAKRGRRFRILERR